MALELPDAEPVREGKSEAASESRWARDSRMRAAAEAMSGLFCNAPEMMRLSVGSSKRFHQRERSLDGEATGKCAAFFQSAGSDICLRPSVEFAPQPLKPIRAKLEKTKWVNFMENLETL